MAWSSKLQCEWKSIRVIGPDTIEIHMPPGNCPDMTGCIEFASSILPGVAFIRTYSDSRRDCSYRKTPTGEWFSRLSNRAFFG